MHQNPDYSKLFRGRPLRFVLPLRKPGSNTPPDSNLITIDKTYQRPDTFNDRIDHKISKSKQMDNNNNNSQDNNLQRKAAAFRLSNGTIIVRPELLCDLGCETPRINHESNLGKEYRYFYAISSDVDAENPGTVNIHFHLLLYYANKPISIGLNIIVIDYQSRYQTEDKEGLVRKRRVS